MDLFKYRKDNHIPEDQTIIDAESMLLSLLLRDEVVGFSINERCLEDYHNVVVSFMQKRNIPVHFPYLNEENNRLIEEKMLGLRGDERIVLSEEERIALADQCKQSPCLNIFIDGRAHSYQLDESILHEIENPTIYNAAITEWSGNPYYTYLLSKIAPSSTVDNKTRERLQLCGEAFAENVFPEMHKEYAESYVVDNTTALLPNQEERTREEQNVVGFFDMLKKVSQSPVYIPAKVQNPDEQ